jgi:hypothetical protein
VPRIARPIALAIHFDEMLRTGEVTDMLELTRRVATADKPDHGPNQLAPDILEALLQLPTITRKPDLHEKRLRPIAAMLLWKDQRAAWLQTLEQLPNRNN